MELKLYYLTSKNLYTNSSNRTFMELKFRCLRTFIVKAVSSNRTFMELKFASIPNNLTHFVF